MEKLTAIVSVMLIYQIADLISKNNSPYINEIFIFITLNKS